MYLVQFENDDQACGISKPGVYYIQLGMGVIDGVNKNAHCRVNVMLEENIIKKRAVRQAFACAVLLVVCAIFGMGAAFFPKMFFSAYLPFSRWISRFIGFLFSFAPISVAEFVIYAIVLFFVGYLIYTVFKALTSTGGIWAFVRYGMDLVFSAVLIVSLFLIFWGFNYTAPPLEERLELTLQPQSEEVLLATGMWLAGKINEDADIVPRTDGGVLDMGGFWRSREKTPAALEALGERNEVFKGIGLTPVKRVTNWISMTYTGISGIYFPLTGECNVNPNSADIDLPYTMLHEMAHRGGFAAEEDANFVAFLACEASSDPAIRYSGAISAFFYCFRAMDDAGLKTQLLDALPAVLWNDISVRQEPEPELNHEVLETVSAMASTINDTYLTAMRQSEGIKSYGRVVDLLIAEYLSRNP